MSDGTAREIRRRLDDELPSPTAERATESPAQAATRFFQDLFVECLGFEATPARPDGDRWQALPIDGWPGPTGPRAARLFAEAGSVRALYVELEELTRTAERKAVLSIARSDRTGQWATAGSFLAVFHAPGEEVWHLVTPFEGGTADLAAGRPTLRRYALGEGRAHRTVADALADLDADVDRVAEWVDEAFSIDAVREPFYEHYAAAFDRLVEDLRTGGLGDEAAERYARITLTRLLVVAMLQSAGYLNGRTGFVRWFHDRYRASGRTEQFHRTWLRALFFEGMTAPAGADVEADVPPDVSAALSGLPFLNRDLFRPTDLDRREPFVSDEVLASVVTEFLERYDFTVAEASPYDVDVAVDPSVLGTVYETHVAGGDRDGAGIYYTSPVEVDLICRTALYEQCCDRADDPSASERRRLVDFVFAEPRDWEPHDAADPASLESILRDLDVVDPACGSGAFLVGMKRVLAELSRKVGERPGYDLGRRIVRENLAGVDVAAWGLRLTEIRLWLSLLAGEDGLPDRRPVFPNVSAELREGDSLVRPVDDELPSTAAIRGDATGDVSEAVRTVRELKRRCFDGEPGLEHAVEAARRDLLAAATDEGDRRTDPPGVDRQSAETSSASTGPGTTAGDFHWALGFPEVLVTGGFDVVVGNPPYVRHGEIGGHGGDPHRVGPGDGGEASAGADRYKDHLVEFVSDRFGLTPYRRSDLYLYFFFRGLDLLRDGGTLAFVTSNSWLDAGYGSRLQEGLLAHAEPAHVVSNRRHRSFADGDVNTAVTVARRREAEDLSGRTTFTTVDVPYDEIATPAVMRDALVGPDAVRTVDYRGESLALSATDELRRVAVDEASLWRLGGGAVATREADEAPTPGGDYSGGRWGRFVRAPDIYFELLERHGEAFAPLSAVADRVRRGVTTGANDFFYLPLPGEQTSLFAASFDESAGTLDLSVRDDDVAEAFREQGFEVTEPMFRIEHEYVMAPAERPVDETDHAFAYTDDGTTWVPNYLVASPREFTGLRLSPGMVGRLVLRVDRARRHLAPGVREYVEWGERWEPGRGARYPERPTCSARTPWYDLGVTGVPDVLFPERIWSSYVAPANPGDVRDNKNLYGIETDSPEAVCVATNAATTWLFLEVDARSSLGEGVLDVDVTVAEDVPVPVPDGAPDVDLGDVRLRGDLFEQLGAEPGDPVSLDDVSDDRRRVDEIALGEWLGMDEETQRAVYEALVRLVGTRIERSESV